MSIAAPVAAAACFTPVHWLVLRPFSAVPAGSLLSAPRLPLVLQPRERKKFLGFL